MPFGRAAFSPNSVVRDYKTQAETLVELAKLAQRATVDPFVVYTAKLIIEICPDRNHSDMSEEDMDMCQLQAIYDAVKYGDSRVKPLKNGFKYVADPNYADYFTSPVDSLKQCLAGVCSGDCFVKGTLVLRRDHRFVPVESLKIGDEIWGYNKWSKVTQTWDRGPRATWKVQLTNGFSMRLTPEHKIWRDDVGVRSPSFGAAHVRLPLSQISELAKSIGRYPLACWMIQPEEISAETIDSDRLFLPAGKIRASIFHSRGGAMAHPFWIKDIQKDNNELDCCDFETDDHYVWLPEADWTVSQCDDSSSLIAALAGAVGFQMGLRAWGPGGEGYSHVYTVALWPKRSPWKRWVGMDATVREAELGWEPPHADALTAAWVGG